MGNPLSALRSIFQFNKDVRIVMVGLDAAGKTSLLYKLRLGDSVVTIPTIGFNVEKVEYKNLRMTMWDIGGQDRLRPLWHHYFDGSDAVIFVVDSADKTRLGTARDELHKMLEEATLADARVLVFANKQDLPGAVGGSEIASALEMKGIRQKWWVQPCVATQGNGLFEGLDWLSSSLKSRK